MTQYTMLMWENQERKIMFLFLFLKNDIFGLNRY
jgi:hypothetical protein